MQIESMQFTDTLEMAKELDRMDPLASYRNKFHMPKQENGDDCGVFVCRVSA